MTFEPKLLSDPFLQLPTDTSIRVVWFTEFAGSRHAVFYGQDLNQKEIATTTQLSRLREDQHSRVGNQNRNGEIYQQPTRRYIWRHEAEITGLTAGVRVPYLVTSVREDGKSVSSKVFALAPQPKPGTPLKILLTSDHQLKPMTSANLQKVAEKIGCPDAIFFAGDLVNAPDRASDWFDNNRGNAFFPNLQGRAQYEMEFDGIKTCYSGGELIQHAPMFTAIGNHEVMDHFSIKQSLDNQLDDAFPRAAAAQIHTQSHPTDISNVPFDWLKNNSFNIDTYEEFFSLPQSPQGGKKYYAVTYSDLRLVVLFIANIWRKPNPKSNEKGRYCEPEPDLNNPARWGYAQHIFEPIAKGSDQYRWLEQELNSSEFKQAKYKIVMFHHPPHSVGSSSVPAYTDPVPVMERAADGSLTAVRYEYPKEADYIIRDVVPLIEKAGVQLVFYGHSHLWNRFMSPSGMHFLESSNVGNTHGAYIGKKKRPVPAGYGSDYTSTGNPNGLEPVIPSIAPLMDEDGKPLPCISSNKITVFSILDTGAGTVSSYYFDTRFPKSEVVKFDEFKLLSPEQS